MPEITGRLRTPRLASAPASPVAGEMYYDTTTSRLLWWNGTTWIIAADAGSNDPPIVTYPARLPNAAAMASATAGERRTLFIPSGQISGLILPWHGDFAWNPSGWWFLGAIPLTHATSSSDVTGFGTATFTNHPWSYVTCPEDGSYLVRATIELLSAATGGSISIRVRRVRDGFATLNSDVLVPASQYQTCVLPWCEIGSCVKGDVLNLQVNTGVSTQYTRNAQVECFPKYIASP